MDGTAKEAMIRRVPTISAREPLNRVREAFEKSGFVFVPVAVEGTSATTISARDMLGLVARSKPKTPIDRLSNKTIAVTKDTSIGAALELMLEREIRTLIVREKYDTVLNDRIILEFLLSHAGKQALARAGSAGIFDTAGDNLETVRIGKVSRRTPLDVAAKRLFDFNSPCLLLDNDSVVTPWDIVIKGL